MNFYDEIINLEKSVLCTKWMLTLKFAILGASNYNKDAFIFLTVCVC